MTTDPLDVLRQTETYLGALHQSVARHDNLGADLTCAGCALREQIAAVLAAPEPSDPTRCSGEPGPCPEHGFHEESLKQPGEETSAGSRGRFRRANDIDAVQWTGTNDDELKLLVSPFDFMLIDPEDRIEDPDETAAVRTHAHGGWIGIAPGDWVLREDGRVSTASDAEFRTEWRPTQPSAPADTDLRERLAGVLRPWLLGADEADVDHAADAVLAVLPAPDGLEATLLALVEDKHDTARLAADNARLCSQLQALREMSRRENSPAPADRAAELTLSERQFLTFALELAADQMAARSDEFDADDEAALAKLRRMADEAQL